MCFCTISKGAEGLLIECSLNTVVSRLTIAPPTHVVAI